MDRLFVPSFFVCIYFSVIFLVPLPLQSLGAEDIWWKQVGCSTVISEHRRTSVLVVLLPPPSPNTLFQASEAFFCVPLLLYKQGSFTKQVCGDSRLRCSLVTLLLITFRNTWSQWPGVWIFIEVKCIQMNATHARTHTYRAYAYKYDHTHTHL